MLFRLIICALAVVCTTAIVAAQEAKVETPEEGVDAIIAYLKKDDLKGLFLQRYGELDREAKTNEEREKLVTKLVTRMQNKRAEILAGYESLKKVTPEITEERGQKVASFKTDKGILRLYFVKGKWMFHL